MTDKNGNTYRVGDIIQTDKHRYKVITYKGDIRAVRLDNGDQYAMFELKPFEIVRCEFCRHEMAPHHCWHTAPACDGAKQKFNSIYSDASNQNTRESK